MAKHKYPPTVERVGIFTAAWREIGPEASFAGMTLAEFETQTSPLTKSLQKLTSLELEYRAELEVCNEAERAAREALRRVVSAIGGRQNAAREADSTAPWASCK